MEPVRIEFLMVDKLSARLDKAVNKMEQMTGKTAQANRQVQELDKSGQSLQKTIGRLASAFAMKELVSKIATVRGEFQQLEVAFKTMLGSAEQADALMQQLTRTAATTPFGLEDVAQGAKQLLAYGFEAEKVNETLIRLGDIAAGLSMPLNDLVYLYGTTMAQGRLYTQDLNQFTGRGIPMIGELAKQFGVAESKVKELVEAGKVGFPEVQKVIENLTDEGGKFGGLMEAQSKTITGQISNIEDAISMMFNELGQRSEGVINTTLSGVSYVIEHYERFGRILLGLVGTYGVYRTAVMTVAAAKSWATAAEMLHYNWLLLVEKAQKMLNATMLANPYVLVATAIAGVVAAMVSMKTETERLKEAEEAYEAQKQKVIEAEEEHRRKMEELCSIAGDEAVSTDTRREALNRLEQKYPDIFAKYDTEYEKLKNIKKIKEEIAALDGRKSITNPANELKGVEDRIKELEGKTRWATEYYQDSYGRHRARNVLKSARTRDEEAELKNLYGKRKGLKDQIRKNEVNAYFENLTGVSNETLAQQIRHRETLLARMTMQEKKYGKITYGDKNLTGTYSRDELQYQLNKLESERNRRNLPTDSSSDWVASTRKRYQAALKAYNDFIKDTSNDLTREEFEKKAKELKDAVDTAKKEYDKVKPGTDSGAERIRKTSEKAAREAEKRKQVSEKLGQELAELQRENDAAEIEAMDEGLQKKLRQIDNDYQARKNEIDKQKSDWKRKNKESGRGGDLSDEQQSAINNANELNEAKRQRAVAEAYREEFVVIQEHLRAYGTYQQQKLAITEEYAEKIRKASSESEKRYLGVERDSLLAGVEAQELKANIDWSVVFGEFGGMFHDLIAPEVEKAKAYMQTDEFRNADHESQETLVSAIRQMEQTLGGTDKVSFKKLGVEITAYQKSLSDLKKAQDDYESTYTDLSKAQQNYIRAVQSGTKEEQDLSKAALDTAQRQADAAAENVSSIQAVASEAQRAMTDTAATLKSSMDGVVDGLRQIASGSLSGAYEGLIKFGNSAEKMGGKLGKAFGKVADALDDVPIIGWIVQIIDLFKDGLSIVIGGILDAVFNAVSGILSDVLSGDLLATIGKSIVNGVSGIFDAITFGGFSSWFDSSNAKEVQETINRLTDRNETLQTAIEDLTDEIKASKGTKSVAAYRDAYKYQQETNANYLQMAQAQAGYHSAHHSFNYYWSDFSDEQKNRLSQQIGRQWNGSLWDLSPEEMKMLRSNVDMWEKIKNTGKGGYGGSVAEKLDDYIDQAGKLEELTNQLYEGLTGISFDGMYGSFIDNLMNMKYDAKAAAEDISEYFMRAMLSNKIGEMYSDKLKEWWEKFGKAMEDNDLTEAERKALADEYMKYVDEAIKLRDNLAAATGYDPDGDGGTSQSAKAGGFSAMTQDQGTKLEGMFTSGLQHWSSMDEKMENVSEKMNAAENHLAKIEENTGKSAGHLEKIAENMVKIIRDGLKVK
ncbi:tape measure protein [Bacteroides sp. AN502(2024)]|uniref:tape measure protein n=1 Tax=Bacteroides sp. AN502(2024) TaxID=3160599 RepID=UPI0035184B0E